MSISGAKYYRDFTEVFAPLVKTPGDIWLDGQR